MRLRLTPQRIWMAAFVFWAFLLTGALTAVSNLSFWSNKDTFSSSAPGLLQLWSLTRHLDERNEKVAQIQRDMSSLQNEIDALEHDPIAQEREVRRTLNYLREDELVFEFREFREFREHRSAGDAREAPARSTAL